MKLKKTYKFAIYSALYIATFATALVSGLLYWLFEFSWIFAGLFFIGIGLFSFFLIQYRVERFIYRSIQKIYKDVSMIDSTTVINHPITTDMAALTEQVKKFATDKKLEIETLKLQEEYRREFLGNVSHELKTPLTALQGNIQLAQRRVRNMANQSGTLSVAQSAQLSEIMMLLVRSQHSLHLQARPALLVRILRSVHIHVDTLQHAHHDCILPRAGIYQHS